MSLPSIRSQINLIDDFFGKVGSRSVIPSLIAPSRLISVSKSYEFYIASIANPIATLYKLMLDIERGNRQELRSQIDATCGEILSHLEARLKHYGQASDEKKLLKSLMLKEMVANSHKGDFMVWVPEAYHLMAEFTYHQAKLDKAMIEVEVSDSVKSRQEVCEFVADLGNYLIKVIQIFGTGVKQRL